MAEPRYWIERDFRGLVLFKDTDDAKRWPCNYFYDEADAERTIERTLAEAARWTEHANTMRAALERWKAANPASDEPT